MSASPAGRLCDRRRRSSSTRRSLKRPGLERPLRLERLEGRNLLSAAAEPLEVGLLGGPALFSEEAVSQEIVAVSEGASVPSGAVRLESMLASEADATACDGIGSAAIALAAADDVEIMPMLFMESSWNENGVLAEASPMLMDVSPMLMDASVGETSLVDSIPIRGDGTIELLPALFSEGTDGELLQLAQVTSENEPMLLTVESIPGDDFGQVAVLYDAVTDGESVIARADAPGDIVLLTAGDLSPWQNHDSPNDVNQDGHITPKDVLIVINSVDAGVQLSSAAAAEDQVTFLVDVDGDFSLTASDAICVTNVLNTPDIAPLSADLASDVAPAWNVAARFEVVAPEIAAARQAATDSGSEGTDLAAIPASPEQSQDAAATDDITLAAQKDASAADGDSLFTENADWLLPELF